MCWMLFDLGWKERVNTLIWIDWFALNWDRGLVNCGTNILRGCWLSWQNEIQVSLHWHLSLQNVLIVVWPRLKRKGKHLDLNWLICIKLGSWSCQLWYQHTSWVLTLLTKRDSGFIALTSFTSKCVSSYLPPTMVITHFLLSPSTISHLQVLLPPSSMREIPYQTPILPLPISTLIANILSLFWDLLFLSANFVHCCLT
jgi:hypothetical protein